MARTPTGVITSVATVLDTAVIISGISNAATGVVTTSSAHGYTDGDLVLVECGWSRINLRAFRVANKTSTTFELEGEDTSNTALFPSGGGAGSVRKVVTWVQLDRTLNHQSSGGDPKTANVKFIESENEILLNDGFNAINRTFEMDADQLGTPGYVALRALTQTGKDTVIRQGVPGGAFTLIVGKVALSEEVQMSEGKIMTVQGSIAAQSRSTRYAA